MLSILIPVYNFNSRPLLESLHSQAEALNIEYEIVVADDASTICKEEIAGIPKCLYLWRHSFIPLRSLFRRMYLAHTAKC